MVIITKNLKNKYQNTSKFDKLKSLTDADESHIPFNYFTYNGLPIMEQLNLSNTSCDSNFFDRYGILFNSVI